MFEQFGDYDRRAVAHRKLSPEEQKLLLELRKYDRVKSHSETDLHKVAHIFHQLGMVYKSQLSPEKKSLIQSVGLLNAAIVIKPCSVSPIKSDLAEVCKHILLLSGAKNQNADLIEKADKVKTELTEWRIEAKTFLDCRVPKISVKAGGEKLRKLKQSKVSCIQQLNKSIINKS